MKLSGFKAFKNTLGMPQLSNKYPCCPCNKMPLSRFDFSCVDISIVGVWYQFYRRNRIAAT
ncbi:MAG: hypothetical protein IPL42_14265 [Saprospiraceae bacterium]|nr:hypothetical protein [Saprospiraceae bacterium]